MRAGDGAPTGLLANHVVLYGGVRIGDDCVIAVAVVPISGPRADGSGAEQSEPAPEIRAGC